MKKHDDEIKTIRCPRCKELIPGDVELCPKCWIPISEAAIQRIDADRNELSELKKRIEEMEKVQELVKKFGTIFEKWDKLD
jgi:hypothetical protein